MENTLLIRNGNAEDEDWLFQLFRGTMQGYIDEAWGWDELLQHQGFITSLPAKNFQILEVNKFRTASFHLREKDDRLVVDMILVLPEKQRLGFGTYLMNQIKESAERLEKPAYLSVLKSNPAIDFHLSCGFKKIEEDEHSIKMSYSAKTSN